MQPRIEIALSKKKITGIFIGALIFVALGVVFLMTPAAFSRGPFPTPVIIGIGAASIVFFGFVAVYAARKLPDTKPGLIIDETGITDNSSAVAAGFIPWTDIDDISVITVNKQSFVILHVKDPKEYIARQKGIVKKKFMQMNFKMYGSPVTIGANPLAISFDELHRLIAERLR